MMSGQQPGRDARSQPHPQYPPPPRLRPRRRSGCGSPAANSVGLVCVATLVALAWSVGPDGDSSGNESERTPVARQADVREARDEGLREPEKKEGPKAVFRVWGSAPAGAETTFGSDSRKFRGEGLPMTGSLQLTDSARYYAVHARLRGDGDIRCSVTVDGRTERGHASGGRAVCEARLPGRPPGEVPGGRR